MMKANFQVNIPKPCHEDWRGFTPTKEGGFCGSCQKNVIDFTKLSDSELVAYFRDLSATQTNTCGRFRGDQLQKNYRVEEWFPTWTVTGKAVNYEVPVSQFQEKTSKISFPFIHKMKIVRNMTMAVLTLVLTEQCIGQQRTITGQLVDAGDGSPLPGVHVAIKGTKKGTDSDVNGKYNISVDEKDTLVFSFVGFKAQEIKTKEIKPIVAMECDVQGYLVMGEPAVCDNNFKKGKLAVSNYKTEIKTLGNPVADRLIIVPQLFSNETVTNLEDLKEAEEWYRENAFQEVEDVQVYDLSGKVFKAHYLKLNDGKIQVNLKFVPAGTYMVRVTYANERSPENQENGVVRIVVLK
jgi:CarboxypepD_reg-like domain